VIVRPETGESLSFLVLIVCCVLAFLTWLVGMVRPKGFGAGPAALYITPLLVALLCSGTIGFLEFVR
jgi:hypothetical protein